MTGSRHYKLRFETRQINFSCIYHIAVCINNKFIIMFDQRNLKPEQGSFGYPTTPARNFLRSSNQISYRALAPMNNKVVMAYRTL